MAQLTPAHLRRWADELEAEEKAELDAAERKRIEELAARPTLDADDVEWLRRLRADLEAEKTDDEAKPEPEPESEPEVEPKAEKTKPKAETKRTRPGRKNGNVYEYDVDDDGRVVHTGMAHIYSGPDEDDEVDLPDDEAEAA